MSDKQTKYFKLTEVTEITGIEGSALVSFIRREWISPVSKNQIDHEDLARIRLILELREDFGANDEAIPLILHLMDQLYSIRHRLKQQAREAK